MCVAKVTLIVAACVLFMCTHASGHHGRHYLPDTPCPTNRLARACFWSWWGCAKEQGEERYLQRHTAGEWSEGGREVSIARGLSCVFMFLCLSPAQPTLTNRAARLMDLRPVRHAQTITKKPQVPARPSELKWQSGGMLGEHQKWQRKGCNVCAELLQRKKKE